MKIVTAILLVLAIVYVLFNYTMRGRVLGLYTFGGFKAPVSTKIKCAKETDVRVDEKFLQPLKFDKKSIDSLKEFWHFSYYRACLFEAGYDFSGNFIPRSEIVREGGKFRYVNHFAEMDFVVPDDTVITMDNKTDPDIEDRRLSSLLKSSEGNLNVLVYRSFDDIDSFESLWEDFEKFSTTTGSILAKSKDKNTSNVNYISIRQDDGFNGLTILTYKGLVVQIFGKDLSEELLDNTKSSIRLFKGRSGYVEE